MPGIEVFTPRSSPSREIEPGHQAEQDGLPGIPSNSDVETLNREAQSTAQLVPLAAPPTTLTLTSQRSPNVQVIGSVGLNKVTQHDLATAGQLIPSPEQLPILAFRWLSSIPSLLLGDIKRNPDISMGLFQPTMSLSKNVSHIDRDLIELAAEKLNSEKAVMITMSRAQNQDGLQALTYLLNLSAAASNTSLRNFAQRLFTAAVVAGNLCLVETLLDSGVNANTRMRLSAGSNGQNSDEINLNFFRMHDRFSGSNVTALQIAVYNRREDMIRTLLRHGANDWHAQIQGSTGYVSGSILDMVIGLGNHEEWMVGKDEEIRSISYNILETLLHHGSGLIPGAQNMFLRALRHAVLQNRPDLVRLLCKYCSSLLEIAKTRPWMLLEAASTLETPQMVDYLIEMRFSITSTTPDGLGSVVAAAAKHSNASLIDHLLRMNANVDGMAFGVHSSIDRQESANVLEEKLEDIRGLTALHIALQNNNETLTRLLLYHGADPTRCCMWQFEHHSMLCPVQLVASCSNPRLRKMLFETGADGNRIVRKTFEHIKTKEASIETCRTAYWLDVVCDAILDGDLLRVEQLLADAKSLVIEHNSQHGIRALVLATRQQNHDLTRIILGAGNNPFDRLDPGIEGLEDLDERIAFLDHESAFEQAVKLGQRTIIKAFVMFSTERLDKEQQISRRRQLATAYASAICDEDTELESVIRASNFDLKGIDQIMGPHYVQQRLHFALQHAAATEQYDKIERLLMAGADPNSPNRKPADTSGVLTPLHYAVKHENIGIVGKLLQAGADVNTPPYLIEGRTVLQLAASIGNLAIVDLLLDAKADVNAPPAAYKGRTAIEAAAEHGHFPIFHRLLGCGADIKGRDFLNFRRLFYRAEMNGHNALQGVALMELRMRGVDLSVVHRWKSITKNELDFASEAAKQEYEALLREYDQSSDGDWEAEEEVDVDEIYEQISEQS